MTPTTAPIGEPASLAVRLALNVGLTLVAVLVVVVVAGVLLLAAHDIYSWWTQRDTE